MLPADNMPAVKFGAQILSPPVLQRTLVYFCLARMRHPICVYRIKGVKEKPLGLGVQTTVSCLFLFAHCVFVLFAFVCTLCFQNNRICTQ